MNKADIITKVHETLNTTKADAERAVECVIDSITNSLKSGQEESIAGLGIFSAKMREARTARNPRTGEEVPVTARRVVTFHCGQKLKARVEKYTGKESQGSSLEQNQ